MSRVLNLLLLTVLVFFLSQVSAVAQTPTLAGGIRLGYPWSLSLKYSPQSTDNAIEGFVGFRSFGRLSYSRVSLGGLYQVHKNLELDALEGLQWYYGGGVSVFFWSYDRDIFRNTQNSSTSVGLLGNIGLNYTFTDAPVNVSVDWVPRIQIGNTLGRSFGYDYGAVSVRYVLRE